MTGGLGYIYPVMIAFNQILKPIVTAVFVFLAGNVLAQPENRLDDLFDQLAQADDLGWEIVEDQIRTEWTRSGSHSMDFLFQRGIEALEQDDVYAAIEHLTALTDHAPDFVEGWHMRAQAYYAAGLYGPAMDDLYRALALEPRHFDSLFGLAILFDELSQPENAATMLRVLETIHPNYPDAAMLLEQISEKLSGQEA